MSNTTTVTPKVTVASTSEKGIDPNIETSTEVSPLAPTKENELDQLQLKKSVEMVCAWLKISEEDLEKLIYFIVKNKEVLLTKLKEKGLQKTWKFITKKAGVEIDLVNLKEVVIFGFAMFKEQIIGNLKAANEHLGSLVESELENVINAFQKSYKANKDIGQALTKSISKISVMGFEGKSVIKNPIVSKAIGELNTMLTPKPEVKTWQPGSMSRMVTRLAVKHSRAK